MRLIGLRYSALALLCAALVFAEGATNGVEAGSLNEFHSKVEMFSGPYKSALFYLRTGNVGVAELELSQAEAAWQEILDNYLKTPPDPFADDPNWSVELGLISKALGKGRSHIRNNEGDAAREALQVIRSGLHRLRLRNNISVLADCIYELQRPMSALYTYRRKPQDLASQAVQNQIKAAAANYAYVLEVCRLRAPKGLLADEHFIKHFDGAENAVARLPGLVDAQDQTRVINAIRELKSFDTFIYLRWG